AQAVSERRLLLGSDLPGHGLPDADVPGPVRDRPPARMDRALERDDGRTPNEDRPAALELRRSDRATVRPARRPQLSASRQLRGRSGRARAATLGRFATRWI